jgi:hypothetical protein
MKPTSLFLRFAIGFSHSLFLIVHRAYPYSGGLDSYACHHNRKVGGYHCHRGPLAGQSFTSKEEMLKKLSADKIDAGKSKEKK